MWLSAPGWQGPRTHPVPPARPAADGPTGGALQQAPALPPAVSRQPAWTTVPGSPGLGDLGRGWSAATWARIQAYMRATGIAATGADVGVAGYRDGRGFVQRVVDLTNRERMSRGLAPLEPLFGLSYTAEQRSRDMIVRGYFAHTDPDGRDPFWHMRRNGVRWRTGGENIAYGQPTPEAVVQSWMNSPGHRANILNPNFGHIGVGAVQNSRTGQIFWTQLFTD